MADSDIIVDCLFSLEVVVEKLYMPHVVCRFPALAFRLLDFPTILIHHVEPDMAARIRSMASDDADYKAPPQFPELKDKHGNFMVKKGKSCLFKISLQSLRSHLTSTPLYVMVVDTFTETPKLLGNSTVPLDTIIENIYTDVSKVGNSIPSVHGDKGLFKIYNLMGKEIGYVILGYRLLSVGPSLVPHLSEQVLAHRGGKSEELPKLDTNQAEEEDIEIRPSSQVAWTSTDNPQQCDALLQTDEFEKDDKSVSANLPQSSEIEDKIVHSISTQTSRKQTYKKTHQVQSDHLSLYQNAKEEKYRDEQDVLTNVCCPPPLFYSSKKDKQTVWLSRRTESPNISETNFEDYSDIVSEAGDGVSYSAPQTGNIDIAKSPQIPQSGDPVNNILAGGPAMFSQQRVTNNNVFPILSALIQELGNLQVPQSQGGLPNLNLINLVKNRSSGIQPQPIITQQKSQVSQDNYNSIQVDQRSATCSHSSPDHKSGRLSHRDCAGDHQGVPKNKSWLRSTPEQAVKKSKLTFGMTNTQRLRLAKSNPHRALDQEKTRQPSKKQLKPSVDDFEEGNLSDMSTEIRRHTLDEIEDADIPDVPSSTQVNRTHTDLDKTAEKDKMRVSFNESVEKVTILSSADKQKRLRSKRGSPKLTRKEKWSMPSRSHNKTKPTSSKKSDLNVNITASNSNEDNNQVTDTPTEDTPRKPQDEASGAPQECLVPDLPQYVPYEPDSSDSDEHFEALSHRSQKSIEVRIPSTEPQSGEESSSPGRPENGASKSSRLVRSNAYWDSLEQNQSANESDNELGQSYVPSWGGDSDLDRYHRSSGVFSSTGDIDTRQFQSTEEAELLDLISDGDLSGSEPHSGHAVVSEDVSGKTKSSDKGSASTVLRIPILNPVASESSPIPSTRRSIARPDLSATSAKDRSEQPSPTSSVRPTPRPRSRKGRELDRKESLHTESVSTYAPSDIDNMNTSLASDPTYSEDFHQTVSDDDTDNMSLVSPVPRFIPSTKLGYTIG